PKLQLIHCRFALYWHQQRPSSRTLSYPACPSLPTTTCLRPAGYRYRWPGHSVRTYYRPTLQYAHYGTALSTTSDWGERLASGRRSAMIPDERGKFGPYGGQFVPETLMPALAELTAAYEEARQDPAFMAELE